MPSAPECFYKKHMKWKTFRYQTYNPTSLFLRLFSGKKAGKQSIKLHTILLRNCVLQHNFTQNIDFKASMYFLSLTCMRFWYVHMLCAKLNNRICSFTILQCPIFQDTMRHNELIPNGFYSLLCALAFSQSPHNANVFNRKWDFFRELKN